MGGVGFDRDGEGNGRGEAVDLHRGAGAPAREGGDAAQCRLAGGGEDEVAEFGQVGQVVFGEHGREAALADAVAGGERVDVADDLVGFADVLAQEGDQRVVDGAPVEEAHDRDLDAFLVERIAVGAEAASPDVDDMGGAGEEADVAAVWKAGVTTVMSCRWPVPIQGSLVM